MSPFVVCNTTANDSTVNCLSLQGRDSCSFLLLTVPRPKVVAGAWNCWAGEQGGGQRKARRAAGPAQVGQGICRQQSTRKWGGCIPGLRHQGVWGPWPAWGWAELVGRDRTRQLQMEKSGSTSKKLYPWENIQLALVSGSFSSHGGCSVNKQQDTWLKCSLKKECISSPHESFPLRCGIWDRCSPGFVFTEWIRIPTR